MEETMADAGLFVGWASAVRGREAKSLEVFNEALAYYGGRQESGAIEGFDVGLLQPHGGDLNGFILVRGSEEQIQALQAEEEFQRLNTRAGLIVEGFGVIPAVIGEGLEQAIAIYQEAVSDLT
jgi:hypothetical protein